MHADDRTTSLTESITTIVSTLVILPTLIDHLLTIILLSNFAKLHQKKFLVYLQLTSMEKLSPVADPVSALTKVFRPIFVMIITAIFTQLHTDFIEI